MNMNVRDFDDILFRRQGGAVFVTLNRPAALNALTLDMVRVLSAQLKLWAADDRIKAVVIDGAGDRAFCAGGDIKAAYKTGMAYRRGNINQGAISVFFGEEYLMNRALYHFPKPLIAVMNGITMGGGYGIAGPCRYRVALSHTVCAMPETAIGFFPDVGSAAYLNAAPGAAGRYLGLTGNHIGAADSLYAKMATHYVAPDKQDRFLADLEEKLSAAQSPAQADADICNILSDYNDIPEDAGKLAPHHEMIEKCFAAHTQIESIVEALHSGPPDRWKEQTAAVLAARSPTSLKVSLRHLIEAADQDFDQITAADFRLAQHFLMGHDFYEGVRAMVIDKDRRPHWEPATLAAISGHDIDRYFSAAGYELDAISG